MAVESWADMRPHLKKLTDAVKNMPPPPKPDDEYAMKMNQLNRTAEGLKEQIEGRAQMEEEFDG